MAKNSAAFNLIFGAKTQQLTRALNDTQRKLRRTSIQMKETGRALTRNLTLPLVGIGAASFKTALDFESSMSKVKAVSGATAKEFEALENKARELGRTTTFTASEVSALQLEFAKLGFTADDINKVSLATLNLAQATGSDLAQAAEVAGIVLGGFQLEAENTAHVTDVMAAAFSSSPLDINKFQESIKNVAPVAQAAGISLEQTTAMLAILAKSGITGSKAGTALRRVISELGATGGNVADAIANLAAQGLNLDTAMDEVGRNAQTALLVLADGIDDVDGLTKSFETADGVAADMAKTMNDNAQGSLKQMGSAVEGAAISIGKALSPAVVKIADLIKNLATRFESLSKGTKGVIVAFGGVLAVAGPLLNLYGRLRLMVLRMVGVFNIEKKALIADAAAKQGVSTANITMRNSTVAASLALKGFRAALITTGLGALVVALGYAVGKLIDFVTESDKATEAETKFNTAIDDGNKRLKDREKILDNLSNGGGGSIKRLREESNALQEEIEALDAGDLAQFIRDIDDIPFDSIGNADIVFTTLQKAFDSLVGSLDAAQLDQLDADPQGFVRDNYDKITEAINNARQALTAQKTAIDEQIKSVQKNADATSDQNDEMRTSVDVMQELDAELAKITRKSSLLGEGFDESSAMLSAFKKALNEIIDSDLDITSEQLDEIVANITNLQSLLDGEGMKLFDEKSKENVNDLLKSLTEFGGEVEKNVNENLKETKQLLDGAAIAGNFAGSVIGAAFDSATGRTENFGEAVRDIFLNMIRGALSTAIANAVTSAFSPASPDNVATGGATAPAKAAGLKAAVAALFANIPAFATGGIVTKPTIGLIGEAGSEAVIPFNRMDEFVNLTGAGSGNGELKVAGRLVGNDLYLMNNRHANNSGRRRVIV